MSNNSKGTIILNNTIMEELFREHGFEIKSVMVNHGIFGDSYAERRYIDTDNLVISEPRHTAVKVETFGDDMRITETYEQWVFNKNKHNDNCRTNTFTVVKHYGKDGVFQFNGEGVGTPLPVVRK